MKKYSNNKIRRLVLRRVFDAPRETVWDAWTDPAQFALWYGYPGILTDVSMDLEAGGEWQATTLMPDGTAFPAIGIYQVIDKPEHLEFSFLNPEDRTDPNIETMRIILKNLKGKTEMIFKQSGNLPPDEYSIGLKKGWTGFFDRLEEILK